MPKSVQQIAVCKSSLKQFLSSAARQGDVNSTDVEQMAEDKQLNQLNKEYESENSVGNEIANTQLAKIVTKMLRSKMADKTLQEKNGLPCDTDQL